jgi:hypothetical protein
MSELFALTDAGVIRAPLHGHPVWRFLIIWMGAGMIYIKSGELIFWATGYALLAMIISLALLVTMARWFMNYWPRDLVRATKILVPSLLVTSAFSVWVLNDDGMAWYETKLGEDLVGDAIYAAVLCAFAYVASRRLKKIAATSTLATTGA